MKLFSYIIGIILAITCTSKNKNITCFTYSKFKNSAKKIEYKDIPLQMVILKNVQINNNMNIYYDSIEVNKEYSIYLKKYTNCPRMFEDIEQDTLIVKGIKIPITKSYNSSLFNLTDTLKSICCDITSLTEITYNQSKYLLLVYYTQGFLGTRGRYVGIFIDLRNGNSICLGNVKHFPIDGISDYDADGNIDLLYGQDTMKIYSYNGIIFHLNRNGKYLVYKSDRYSHRKLILIDKSKWFYPIMRDGDTTCVDTARLK